MESRIYLSIPTVCPKCGHATTIKIDKNSGVKTLWCTNANCGGANIQRIKHAVTRDALNIDGVSEATIEDFVNAGIIEKISDLFNLEKHYYEIINMDGYGYKSYDNLEKSVEKARDIKAGNFVYALGIPNVGLNTAKLICRELNITDESAGELDSITYDELIAIDGIGNTIADSFVSFFEDDELLDEYVELWKNLNITPEESAESTLLSGLTFCVTGDVYIFNNRREVKEYIENNGGKLTGSVSRSTNYLITNDTTSGSNKNKAAQEYGIPIITEQEFIDKFGGKQ